MRENNYSEKVILNQGSRIFLFLNITYPNKLLQVGGGGHIGSKGIYILNQQESRKKLVQ